MIGEERDRGVSPHSSLGHRSGQIVIGPYGLPGGHHESRKEDNLKDRMFISAFASALVCSLVAVTAAASSTPRELFRNKFLAPSGHVANLVSGATYKASDFPLAIRVTIPDGRWGGAQWKYDSSYQRKKNNVAPFYGWVTFEARETSAAQGVITMMTPYARTRSVAAVVAGLRTRGRGATYGASSPVKLGGYSGVQFDGKVVGKE